jgi:acetyl/propionyl-CoA carboxylase alpha subunit
MGAFVMKHPAFIKGDFDTKFIEKHFKPEMLKQETEGDEEIIAVAADVFLSQKSSSISLSQSPASAVINWHKNRKTF